MKSITLFTAIALVTGGAEPQRPDWAAESVPDTVWVLVERANADPGGEAHNQLLREAQVHAVAAVAEREQDVGRRYALAVVLGLRANSEGGQDKVRAAAALSAELETILAAEPSHVGARHMLGRLHAGVRRMNRVTRWVATNLLGGSELKRATWEAAEEHLVFAEQHAPEVADHHLQLARLYLDTDRRSLAAQELAHVLALEPRSPYDEAVLAEARQVWSDIAP